MTLTLHLPADLEQRLVQAAQHQGLSADQFTLRLLDSHLPAKERGSQLAALIQTWIDEGDLAEQTETGEYLVRALDDDRLSDRKLFPPELKGVTW
ncbi:MAG: hypothetical protein HYS13_23180 [Planctomycetia bacterium]|nr:hypothetical protein [Planctomycetia bacterium]